MHANAKITVRTPLACAFAIAATAIALSVSASAAEPVVVWDGAVAAYDFSTLTRTVGGVTYELRSNSIHDTVTDSYIQLATANQEAAPTITASAGASNPFGNGGCTVVLKCSNMPVSYDQSSVNRALIALFDGSNKAMIGIKGNRGSGGFIWDGGNYSAGGTQDSIFSSGSQTIALTYSTGSGTSYYVNGAPAATASTLKSKDFKSPAGIAIGGLPVSGSTMFYGMRQMKILAVAVFDSTLGADEVSAYKFPSEMQILSGSVSVSVINALFGSASEISVRLADGATVNGDTTFNASKVHFICDGSFTIAPPAGNTAAFDFFGVSGKPVVRYSSMPTVSGSVFTSTTVPAFVTDSTQWSGVIYISGGSFTNFSSNDYGNESSVVRLGNVSGWLRAPGNYAFTNSVPVELVGVLTINNGNSANDSNPNRCTVFRKLSGNGYIFGGTSTDGDKSVIVIQDASEFTGNIGLQYRIVVFGDSMPSYADNNKFNDAKGSIWVMEGASVTANPADGNWWATGGIWVNGELRASGLDKFGDGTHIEMSDTGKLTLSGAGNVDDSSVNFGRIRGTGTIRLESASNWRTIPLGNFPTSSILENELGDGLLLMSPGQTYTIGSLSGSKTIRTDWSSGDRNIRVLQAKDTTYGGSFDAKIDRLGTVTVAPGTETSGTLTLSGTQTACNDLVIESGAKVNLTGTWKGPVIVNGTISGTGTVDGDLTLEDGATINIDLDSPLDVRGKIIEGNGVTINPRPALLNGKAQNVEKTIQLIGLFGGDALSSAANMTFNIGGIDMSDGTLRLDVTPPVLAGNSLSVFGKAELGDRWRRLKVNPEGSSVSIYDEDLADCRFFQIRAELGEMGVGYPVSENPSTGDGGTTERQSHFASLEVGGSTALFTFSLEGGAAADYGFEYYKTLAFQVEGVTAGAIATLSTNGVVAASAEVGKNGSVSFGNVPPLESGTTLSFGISTANAEGKVTTTNLNERAGVLSYEWGDSVTNEVSGGVTNVVTTLANRPFADGMKDSNSSGWYRIPAMAMSTNGVVVALYDCRLTGSGDLSASIDWAESWSGDGGATWAKPRIAVDVPNVPSQTLGKKTDISDPCILYDPGSNRFFAMGITGGGLTKSHVNGVSVADVALYVRGTGEFDTWQEWTGGPAGNERSVKQLALDGLAEAEGNDTIKDENAICGILEGPGHGFVQRKQVTDGEGEVVMPSGALVFSMQFFPTTNNYATTQNFALYSTDGGATWAATALTPTNTPAGKDCYAQEGCIVELDDGTWEYMAKYGKYGSNFDTAYGSSQGDDARENCRLFFRSRDFKTWSFDGYHPHKSVRSQGSCLWLGEKVKTENGGTSLYAACFSTWGNYKAKQRRGGLKLFFGRDTSSEAGKPGITWDRGELEIRHEHTSACSYNSMVMLDDWTLGVAFESDGHIYFRKVDVRAFLNK